MLKKNLTIFTLFVLSYGFLNAQNYAIEQVRISDGKKNKINIGDKVLISFNQLSSESINRPNDVFINSKDTGKTRTVLKAKITNITQNSIQFKDRSVHGTREIRLDKIIGIRKLTIGKQILRVSSEGIGILSLGLAIAYLPTNLWASIGLWVGGFSFIALASDDFHQKYDNNWTIRIVPE
jgi:hypothetical protein